MENTNLDDLTLEDVKNIKISSTPSFEEKIDYIYNSLKADKRNKRIKNFIKIIVLLILVYWVYFYLPSLAAEKKDEYKQKVTTFLSKNISEFIWPIVQNVVQDTVKNMDFWIWNIQLPSEKILNWTNNNSTEITKELQKKYDMLKKIQNN